MPEAQDWVSIRKQIEDKKAEISAIDDQIADKSEIGKAISDEKNKLRKEIDSESINCRTLYGKLKRKLTPTMKNGILPCKVKRASYPVRRKLVFLTE